LKIRHCGLRRQQDWSSRLTWNYWRSLFRHYTVAGVLPAEAVIEYQNLISKSGGCAGSSKTIHSGRRWSRRCAAAVMSWPPSRG